MADDVRTTQNGGQSPEDPAEPGGAASEAARYGAGDRIGGNYRLLRILGRGGMGDVWLAHNETLDVDVAVKLVRPASEEKDAAKRLLREARAAARLGHPAIVRIFDFGETERGDPFIVMERLEGEDLATALGRLGRLNPVKAVRTLLPIAHALVAAHGKGIVHRDLKPENIFLARIEGDRLQPKIVDFGIAQVERGKGLRISRSGELLGSPAYMAPEQASGEEVDHRADVWSLSVVLYEAIAGKRPFTGDTHASVLRAIVSGDPEPLSAVQGDDGALSLILRKGLEKDPANRFSSMRDVGEALAAWLLARGVTEDITGASIEIPWGRSGPASEDGLGAVPVGGPEPARPSRKETATVHRGQRPAAAQRPSRLVLTTAVVAVLAGIAVGVIAGARRHSAPKVAPRSSGDAAARGGGPPSATAAASSGSAVPIPVAPLDQIPVDERSENPPASRGGMKTKGPAAFGHPAPGAPKRSLKDPFR